MNVLEKLNTVRTEFAKSEHRKSGNNKYAGYEYFELKDFLPEVLTLFAKNGLCGIFSAANGLASLDVFNIEKPDEKIVFTCPLGSANLKACHEIQNIGACITYTRRYLWGLVVELIENDALDATTGKENPDDWTDVFAAMKKAPTLKELQAIFGPAYSAATAKDKAAIKTEYDRLKAALEKKK